MLLKCFNQALVRDSEKTYLTAAATAADTSLTVVSTDLAPAGASSNTWANNDYMIIGEVGSENAEVMQMAAAVTSATSLTIDREGQAGGLRYNHSLGEPVYRIAFNRVEFSQNSTDTTSGATVLTTIPLQVDDLFTRYEDQSNTTGYGFVRFNNETTGAFSSYSDGVNYDITGTSSSRDARTLGAMRRKIREFIDEKDETKITDQQIDDAINDKQRDIAHITLWSFYEVERTFSSVADQFAYDIPSTVQKIYNTQFDTQPLVWVNFEKWKLFHWDRDESVTDPSHFCIWNGQLLFWPRPSASASTTTLGAAISSATATTVTVASTTNFNRGDYYRFIIDSEVIYATASTATTFTGCLRGREGTTAATHLNGATVTERDISYTGHAEPTNLIDTQDRTSIPEPEVLTYGVSADLALQLDKETLHDRYKLKYDEKVKSLKEKYSLKQTSQFGRIKDVYEVTGEAMIGISNPNLFPRSIG